MSMDHSSHDASHGTMPASHCSGHGGGGHEGGHPMVFSHSTSAVLLFERFQVGPDLFSYLFACVVIVLAGVLRQELVKMSEQEHHSSERRAALYFAQATISYLLMLIAMTFNVGLFLAVMIGLTAGFYRSLLQSKNKSECCA